MESESELVLAQVMVRLVLDVSVRNLAIPFSPCPSLGTCWGSAREEFVGAV